MTLSELRAQQAQRRHEETRAWVIDVTRGRTFTEASQIAQMDRAAFCKLVVRLGLTAADMPECKTMPRPGTRLSPLAKLAGTERKLYRQLRARGFSVEDAWRLVMKSRTLTNHKQVGYTDAHAG
jgi:hypothetical protein